MPDFGQYTKEEFYRRLKESCKYDGKTRECVRCGELDRDNLDTTMRALGGDSGKAIAELVRQVETLVAGPVTEKEPEPNDPNPFTSLFAFKETFGSEKQKIEIGEKTVEPVVGDSEIEQVIRSQAILDARRRCLQLYNRCKSALKMPVMDN